MSFLFAYGTLQHSIIIEYVLGRVPRSQPARLNGYRRRLIRDADYPGIIPDPDESVDGLVFEIREQEWEKLDTYESDLYTREHVTVLLDHERTATAWAYVIPPEHQTILSESPWELSQYQPNLP